MNYTYLIGWKKHNIYYYGCRYSDKATLNDLWVTYFTSSKNVEKFSKENGKPDIIQIRKIFETKKECAQWEKDF